MCPWKVDAIQKSGFSKRFVDSNNSTIKDSILLFVEDLYLDDPYNEILAISFLQWFNNVSSRLLRLSSSFVLCSENKGQRKR